ncbi:MAG TPA: hypothetical protein VMN56_14445 [Casimicrobiaceae bacterium]|nr:hypothetical protein [Casimicrobiaceae bacterium]
MRQLVYSAAFWVVLVIVIRLAVCFPKSLLARVLFSHHGPVAARDEPRAAFSFRRARHFAALALQCAAILALASWLRDGLADSLYLAVLLDAVVPVLGALAAAAALWEVGRGSWLTMTRRRSQNRPRAGKGEIST